MELPLAVPQNLTLQIEGPEAFDVRQFTLEDGLSTLFYVDLVATSSNPAVDLDELIGKPGTFSIGLDPSRYPASPVRTYAGVVSEILQLRAETTGLSTYRITLAPRLWLLTQRTNCRVFQQKTDLDVVLELLAEWDIAPLVECTRAYKARKIRIQYQESDFSFISRLLEVSGITFLFRQTADGTALVLRDAPERGEVRPEPMTHSNEPDVGVRWATALRATRAVRPGKVTFADHDPRLANTPLLAGAKTGDHPVEAQLEHFVYRPGAFKFVAEGHKDTPSADDRGRARTAPDEADRLASEAAFARATRSQRFAFDTNWLDVLPGERTTIQGHPLAERHGELLVTRTTLSGDSGGEIRVSCDAASAGTPHRPEQLTPWPQIHGVECATVVGPEGETIHCDEYGRVRVQFHWDRYGQMNEQSSAWVPVNQPWAGGGLGAINIPRIGQEVMVSFIGGNPEEPMIVGRMYTNLLRPPFALPANKTQNGFKSASVPETGGYNEIMFEDAAGKELVRMRAEKDMTTRVNNDQSSSIGRHRSAKVDGNDRETVKGDQRNGVLKNMLSAIGGDQLTSVFGNLVSAAGKQRLFQTLGDFVSDALSHRVSSKTGTTLTVGKSMIHIGPDSIVIQTPKLFLNPGQDVADKAAMGEGTPAPTPGASGE
ncbi:MAG: type VI secretion system tip protein VgrG [Polyangiaceae bacterium]|nr:type VI secretion system tip protein VgrG [Polyangiaceae bacterium]